jgi:excisionase family DNA binding protein
MRRNLGIRKEKECNENLGKKLSKIEEKRQDLRGENDCYSGQVYTHKVKSKYVEEPRKKLWDSTLLFENLTWLTSNEAAQYLRLPSVGALRVLVCKRRVPFHKLGRNLRFKKAELDRLMEASRNGGI